jgi:hypothetical protein
MLRVSRPGNRQAAVPLPAPLKPQAFGEVAAKVVLPEVEQLALQIDPDLAADVAPAAAERVILRQIAAGIRIDHAVEEQPVQMRLLVRRAVRNVIQPGVFLRAVAAPRSRGRAAAPCVPSDDCKRARADRPRWIATGFSACRRAEARPLFVNRAARELLDARDGLGLEASALSASDADGGRTLRRLIASCAAKANAGIDSGGKVALRRGEGRLPLDALVTPIQPETAMAASSWTFSQRAIAIVLVSDPEKETRRALKTCANGSVLRRQRQRSRLRSSRATAGRPPPIDSASL